MATITKQSSALANRDASPRVLNNPGSSGGVMRVGMGSGFVTTGDNSPSTYAFCEVPSNAYISSLRLMWDGTGGTTTACHVGVWSVTADGGGAVSNAFFATAQTLSAALISTEVVHEAGVSGTSGINGMEKPLWQQLGLAADPGCHYDIKAILANTADNSGTLGAVVYYSF